VQVAVFVVPGESQEWSSELMPTDKDFKMLEKQIKQDKKKLEQMASELKHSYASDCEKCAFDEKPLCVEMNIVELQEHIAKVMESTSDPEALEIILQLSRMVQDQESRLSHITHWLYEAGKPFLAFERERQERDEFRNRGNK
jgi:hypothetical protein